MASTTTDKRLTAIENEKNAAIKESDSMYQSMINQSDGYFDKQVAAVKDYEKTQLKNQQDQYKQTIKEIEQQKEYAYKDFQKEGSAAYADWKKQTNEYGSNAEKMADMGLAHSGYSEQSQVAMYNTYQNRVATARESYQRSVDNYNNAINQATLQNNSLLAEIAFNTLQTSLELSLQGFQYKNTLVQAKADAKRNISDSMWGRYTDTLSQINTENAQAEQIRQYNASLKEQQRQYNQNYALDKKKYNESVRQYNANRKLQQQQLAEEKRQFNENLAWQKKKAELAEAQQRQEAENLKRQQEEYLKKQQEEAKKGDDNNTKNKETSTLKALAIARVNSGNIKTYSDAKSLLKTLKITKVDTPLLNSLDWTKYKKMGALGSEFEGINSYSEYIKVYCLWAIGNS